MILPLLLFITSLLTITVMLVQLTGLEAIKASLAAGLTAGLEEISLEAGKDLSSQIEDRIRQELTALARDTEILSEGEVFTPILSSRLLLIPDFSTRKWLLRPKDQFPSNGSLNSSVVALFQSKLSEVYQPWRPEAESKWPFPSDSVLVILYQENYFTPTLELYFKPILHPETGIVTGVAVGRLDRFALKERIVEPFFEKALSPDLPKRPDGIDPEFVFMSLREPDGTVFYSTSVLTGGSPEVSIPLEKFTRYLAPMELRAGFLWKNSEEIAESIYQRNFWMISGVFCCLLILLVSLYLVNRKADQLDQLKSDFLVNTGHELKTPLAAIKLAGDSLKLGRVVGRDQIQRSYDIIHQEANRLEASINRLMDMGKLQQGSTVYSLTKHEAGVSWNAWTTRLSEYALLQGISLQVDSLQGSVLVNMDSSAIEEVLMILLDNAIDHAHSRQPLRLTQQISGNRWVIRLQDQGVGISKQDQQAIFEPFVRLGDHDIQKASGHGMGLYIARTIMLQHKGRISLDSEVGQGSTFTIELPIISS